MRGPWVLLDAGGWKARSPRHGRLALGIAMGVGATAGESSVHAETPRDTPAAIEVDREPAPAGRVGFGFDGGEPVDAWGASIAAGWLERPIRLATGALGSGSPASDPVRRRETLSLGGALALGDSVVIDLGLRASHQVGDRLHATGDPAGLARYVFHDVRFGGRIRVAGNADRAALLRADLTLPSGNTDQFAGDPRWTAAWSLIGRASLPRDIVVAANVGIRLHGAEVAVGDRLVGDEFFAAVGVAVPLPPVGSLLGLAAPPKLTGELAGSLGDHVGTLAGPDPLEARLGVIVQPLPDLTIAARAGFGLDQQIGAPSFRGVLAVAWTPQAPRRPEPAPSSSPPLPASPVPDDDPDDDNDGTR
jgi:hypothetical protein